MEIDLKAAERFLRALSSDSDFTFQTFTDGDPKPKPDPLARHRHGTLARHAPWLKGMQGRGAGAFVMVNRGDGFGRRASNVIAGRALFLDLDGAPLGPVLTAPIAPRIVVESSPGKWHAYWPIADLPLDQFSGAQKTLAARFGGDPKVCDRPRVMRLPGFIHAKGQPFVSRLELCEAEPLTWHEMATAFDLPQRLTLPKVISEGSRNDTLYRLARASAAKGVPEREQVKRALQVNAERCVPPLAESEVLAAVASAYQALQEGAVAFPYAVMDSPAYTAVSDGARTLLLLAYRKLDGFNNGRISLAWSECSGWFSDRKRFYRLRDELVRSGLLDLAQPPIKPKRGEKPVAGLYRLPIGVKTYPYQDNLIGPKTSPLEAFQAVAVEGSKGTEGVGGANDSEEADRSGSRKEPGERSAA